MLRCNTASIMKGLVLVSSN